MQNSLCGAQTFLSPRLLAADRALSVHFSFPGWTDPLPGVPSLPKRW